MTHKKPKNKLILQEVSNEEQKIEQSQKSNKQDQVAPAASESNVVDITSRKFIYHCSHL